MSSTPADQEMACAPGNHDALPQGIDSQEFIVVFDTGDAPTTAAAPMAGHKRTRSSAESEVVATEATPPKASGPATTAPKHVLIMHLNSIVDCKDAAISTIRETMTEVFSERQLPEVSDEAILWAFAKSPIFFEILAHLGITEVSQEERDRVMEAYPRIYNLSGQPRIQKAPGAVEFLEEVKRRDDIALAVMSNNPQRAAELLGNLGMGELVEMVLASTGAQAGSTGHLAYELFWDNWKKVVEPWLIARSGGSTTIAEPTITVTSTNGDSNITTSTPGPEAKNDNNNNNAAKATNGTNTAGKTTNDSTPTTPIKPEQVMVVSCALYDLGMAKLAGMETVWVKKISLDDEAAMQAVKTHPFVVDDLKELHNLLFVGSEVEDGDGDEQLPTVPEASDEDEDQVMQSQDQVQTAQHEDQVSQNQDKPQVQTAEEDQVMETGS